MTLILWSSPTRRLELHVDGPHRVAVLVEGAAILGMWRLPSR